MTTGPIDGEYDETDVQAREVPCPTVGPAPTRSASGRPGIAFGTLTLTEKRLPTATSRVGVSQSKRRLRRFPAARRHI